MITLQTFNLIWSGHFKELRPLTKKEFEEELKHNPNLTNEYSTQKQIAFKYIKDD
jgi:hypothetical protein